MKAEIRGFPEKTRLKEYTSMKPALHDMLKDCFKKRNKRSETQRNTGTKGKNE